MVNWLVGEHTPPEPGLDNTVNLVFLLGPMSSNRVARSSVVSSYMAYGSLTVIDYSGLSSIGHSSARLSECCVGLAETHSVHRSHAGD